MEDVHRIVPNLGDDPHTAYFAVYDGHGGVKNRRSNMCGVLPRVDRMLYGNGSIVKAEALLNSSKRRWRTTLRQN